MLHVMGKQLFICTLLVAITLMPVATTHAVSQQARVVINEIQTESSIDANQEFIELVNISNSTVDLSGWTLQYRAATGTTWAEKALLSGELYARGSIIIATQGYLSEVASFFWTQAGGVMAATGGNIRLLPANSVIAEDTVAWGTGAYGELAAAGKAPKGSSIQRKFIDQTAQDTDSNYFDFEVVIPSPQSSNIPPVDQPGSTSSDPQVVDPPLTSPSDPVPVVTDPVPDTTIQIEQPTEPAPTENQPDTTSTDPSVVDPIVVPQEVPTQPDPAQTAPDAQPDPITQPPVSLPALQPLVINELMIDPASPLLDAQDEWIELYNPNNAAFSLVGYKLQTGGTFSHSYSFPEGNIPPYRYAVFRSSQTELQLSNTSGAVRVMDPEGMISGTVVTYDESETGNSFALDNSGNWLWTTTPTPETVNVFTIKQELLPPVKVSTKSSVQKGTSTTQKVTTPKTAPTSTAKKASAASVKSTKSNASPSAPTAFATSESAPSHPVALAGFALLAVGYALYEYREDFANKLRLAKRYLETWRGRRASL